MIFVKAAIGAGEISVTVIGGARAISTGFVSAVEAEGWRAEEVPDVLSLFAQPLAPRTVIVAHVPAFTATVYVMIRKLTSILAFPIVVASAECRPEIVGAALQAGADDFLPIPVTIEEMIARLAAVIRVRFGVRDEWHRSDYHLDWLSQTVTIGGGPAIRLSVGEFRLFRVLFAARNRPVSRERLAATPLPHTVPDGQTTLDAMIRRLRRRLGAGRIVAIRGVGFQLVDNRQLPPNVSYLHEAARAQ